MLSFFLTSCKVKKPEILIILFKKIIIIIIIRRYHPFKTEEKTLNEKWIFLQKFNPYIFEIQNIYIYIFLPFYRCTQCQTSKTLRCDGENSEQDTVVNLFTYPHKGN